MTFIAEFPEAYKELLRHKEIVEQFYKAPCDLDFTIEKGRLFLLDARPARMSARAQVRSAIDFFLEGKTTLQEALSYISPEAVHTIIGTELTNRDSLKYLGNGLAASPGSATGRILLKHFKIDSDSPNAPFIFLCEEVAPEDRHTLLSSKGALTIRGGKTSHAAVIMRGMGRPCVTGYESARVNWAARTVRVGSIIVSEGEWITIDGSSGSVFLGRGKIRPRRWQSVPELQLLFSMVRHILLRNAPPSCLTGTLWSLWDFFIHNQPLVPVSTNKKSVAAAPYNISFVQPSDEALRNEEHKLIRVPASCQPDVQQILVGFYLALSRIHARQAGIGNHYKYFRPLWDPIHTLTEDEAGTTLQFVGFEFFNISQHVSYLPDIDHMQFQLKLELNEQNTGWFIDRTNPYGESLTVVDGKILAYALYVNDAFVPLSELASFYTLIRRREYSQLS